VRGLVLHPIVGVAVGLAAASVGGLATGFLGSDAGALAAAATLGALGATWSGRRAAPAIVARWGALAFVPAGVRPEALVLAALLGRWGIVVQCHGGRRATIETAGSLGGLLGRAEFREFGGASVLALGIALSRAQLVGLIVASIAAGTTLAIRIAAHRLRGGLDERWLGATADAVEVVTLALLGGASWVLG